MKILSRRQFEAVDPASNSQNISLTLEEKTAVFLAFGNSG